MASSSTDPPSGPSTGSQGRAAGRPLTPPEPLPEREARAVPGVLGRICLERLADYVGHESVTVSGRERDLPLAFDNSLTGRRPNREAGASPLAVIAEIKRASPSQGPIADLDPVAAAADYAAGGAAALSVLTEPRHFGGSLQALEDVVLSQRGFGNPLPVLRKDFTVHPLQVVEAADAGASAVLLMVAVLGERLADYLEFTSQLGLQALVEVHTEAELDLALAAGSRIIGVNNRDLVTLSIDLGVSPRLLERARGAGHTGPLVAESGYRSRDDLRSVEGLADAVLIGTSLAGSGDLASALRALTGPAARTR